MTTLMTGSLRERKKMKTKMLLKLNALQLFLANGYNETTVEQIAAATEVSPSTFFRYFTTKEDILFDDPFDETLVSSFHSQAPELSTVQAFRIALHDAFTHTTTDQRTFEEQRHQLIASTPELQARNMNELIRNVDLLAQLIAQRTRQSPDSLGVRTLAGALVGVLISVTMTAQKNPVSDYLGMFDVSLDYFENYLHP